ncbi:AI-2E family transporter [uncultured Chloroflexus sp.]|uniref:AI-2E family transporter n=1 Tax=uncultured Chloroflexus sp. TaxID=214040 RepID=UPI00262DA336|nr:AI-2E family transporter [uncultured Chloroflexus sp.]
MDTESRPIRFSYQAKWISSAIIVALAIVLVMGVSHILPPFIGAIITAYLFNPLVGWLHRRTRLGRALWIVVLYVVAGLALYSLFTALWPRIVQQSRDLAANAPIIIRELTVFFEQNQSVQVGDFEISLLPLEAQIIGVVRDIAGWLSGNVPKIVFSALESVIYLLVYLIITFYLLLQAPQLKEWVCKLIPAPYRREIGYLGYQIDRVFSAYIRGQLILIVIMSVLLYIPLSILQVPYALVIAVTSGVLEILPIIGPWSAAGIAMTVALFQPVTPFGLSNVALAVLLGIIYFVLRQIEDHFIIPNVMGPLVRLHPGVVIFAILAGGALAGAFGLFISIPIAATIRILLSYIYRKLTDQPEPPSDTDRPLTVAQPESVPSEVALGS